MKTIAAIHIQYSLLKRVLLLTLSAIFLAIFALAFHQNDHTFLMTSCPICNVKIAISGTMSKHKIDAVPAITIVPIGLTAVSFLSTAIIHGNKTIFISSQVSCVYPNKAPPVRS